MIKKLNSFKPVPKKEITTADGVPEDVTEEILKGYAEDLFEEFQQIMRFEGKITMKDVADILQIGYKEEQK